MASSVFDLQFNLLKKELDLIDTAIRQIDDTTKGVKNWTIVTWTAAMGAGLSIPALSGFLWLTTIVPVLFWVVDGSYRRVQRSFIVRNRQIRNFVNSDEFIKAAREGQQFEFELLVLRANEQGRANTLIGVMLFRTVGVLYVGLAVTSLIVAASVNF